MPQLQYSLRKRMCTAQENVVNLFNAFEFLSFRLKFQMLKRKWTI